MEQKVCDRCGAIIQPRKLFRRTGEFDVALEQEFKWYGPNRKKI